MNENLDLTKILDGCPPGTEFYHLIYGQVALREVIKDEYPIVLEPINKFIRTTLTKDGRMNNRYDGECLLYPSKTQRDWSKFERFWDESEVERFDPKTFQPFDKVLARCTESEWMPTLFGFFIDTDNKDPFSPFVLGERVVCVDIGYQQCIPYNEKTKHLVGTSDDCPEYYKWWKDK